MEAPRIGFVETGEGRVAYQVVGDGDRDLVFMPSPARWQLDVIWEQPRLARFLQRLASFSRLILLNPRGTAISDGFPDGRVAIPEDRARDVIAVLDELGSKRPAFFAAESSVPGALYHAAAYPDRIARLALLNGFASLRRAPGYPVGMPDDVVERFFNAMADGWGTGRAAWFGLPGQSPDERLVEWMARLERSSFPSDQIRRFPSAMMRWDVRSVLPSIRVPTLVMSHTQHIYIRVGHGRYLAEHVEGAIYRERDHPWSGLFWEEDAEWVLGEVETFLTGEAAGERFDERVLATVLFTDIVDSTGRAAQLGDQRWRDLLEEHDTITRREVELLRGRLVKSTGDGVLATFDGPARAIRCARALNSELASLGIQIRAGLHTGEIELRGEDVTGIAVVIGARVMAEADAGQVLVSSAVPPLVAGSGMDFTDLGARDLKGVPGDWHLFAVV